MVSLRGVEDSISPFLNGNFLQALVPQEHHDNAWCETFPHAKDQAASVLGIALSRKMRAKLRQCLSDKRKHQKRRAKDLSFAVLGYRSLFFGHVPKCKKKGDQQNFKS